MLGKCGLAELAGLYSDVPEELRLKAPYDLPEGMSDTEIRREFDRMGRRNITPRACFAGGGFYDHYVPAAATNLVGRSEFLTAYTPYQPEISQGTLQYIFEYQTMMARLTGLEISNASMYDGATAAAEAMMMAVAAGRKRRRVLVSETLNPAYRRVIDTYARYHGIDVVTVAAEDGVTSRTDLAEKLADYDDLAAVIVPIPNYYGIVEDLTGMADEVHARKALLVTVCVAADLAVLRTPGEWGADIACGEAQSLGMPLNYGGPALGYLCCRRALMRKLPGRIVGATVDSEGRRSFVLTLQAREQHIRRHKATSNICSNQGIMTLHAAIYLSLMGSEGLRRVNELSASAAHSLCHGLCATGKVRRKHPDAPFLNEFAVEIVAPLTADRLLEAAAAQGILGGVKLSDDSVLIAATEMCSPADVDRYVELLKNLEL